MKIMVLFVIQKSYDVKTPVMGNNIPNGEYGFQMNNGSWAGAMGLVERKVYA